jgi:hypothetical protein
VLPTTLRDAGTPPRRQNRIGEFHNTIMTYFCPGGCTGGVSRRTAAYRLTAGIGFRACYIGPWS